jgi:hypothetical protein
MRTSFFAITLIFLCSCSNVPKPASYPLSYQHKMQAVHHWDVLADDVAKEVKLTLQDRALLGERIYLEPHERSDFGDVFNTLLTTQLFNREIVLTKNEGNSVKLSCKTRMVKHRSNRHTSPLYPGEPLLLTALGSGVYKAIVNNNWTLGAFATAGAVEVIKDIEFEWTVPHHEIVITAELTTNDTVIARRSNIYYINDADFWHYSEEEMPTKSYTCVSE